MFFTVTISWIFFRSNSIADAFSFLGSMSNFSIGTYFHPNGYRMIDYYVIVIVFLCYEFIIRKDERSPFNFKNKYVRFFTYTIMIFVMMLFYDNGIDRSFIYFQF